MGGVVYIGCTPVVRFIIESHVRNYGLDEIEIPGIVNLDRNRSSGKANFDSLYDLAEKYGIPIHYSKSVNDRETLEFVSKDEPDIVIQSGWSQKFGQKLLSIPRLGCLGEHPTPIPIGRGAASVNWAIIEGQTRWGDSFFRMIDEYDAGPVYAQEHFEIEPHDTCKTVYDKVASTSSLMIQKHLGSWIRGEFQEIELDESKATHYPRRRPEDGEVSWDWKANKILRYVQALTRPYPGAFFRYEGQVVRIWEAHSTGRISSLAAGTFLDRSNSDQHVVCGDQSVLAMRLVQAEGCPDCPGSRLMDIFSS